MADITAFIATLFLLIGGFLTLRFAIATPPAATLATPLPPLPEARSLLAAEYVASLLILPPQPLRYYATPLRLVY